MHYAKGDTCTMQRGYWYNHDQLPNAAGTTTGLLKLPSCSAAGPFLFA